MTDTDENIDKLLRSHWSTKVVTEELAPRLFELRQSLKKQYGVEAIEDGFQDSALRAVIPFPNQNNLISRQYGWQIDAPDNEDMRYWQNDAALLLSIYGNICTIRKEANLRNDLFEKISDIVSMIEKYGFIYIAYVQMNRPSDLREGKNWDFIYFDEM